MKVHEVNVNPALPERIAWLGEIARNVWSAWNPEAGDLFARLDPEAWERLGHNPVALLRNLPQETLDAAAADESFAAMVARVARRLDAYVNEPGWLLGTADDAKDMLVAYFSLEFGLDRGIPLYSGGLGILAGDHLKSASRPRRPPRRRRPAVPQRLLPPAARPDGGQQERYPATDWSDLPLVRSRPTPRGARGGRGRRWATRPCARRCAASRWAACRCYLLDTNVAGNTPRTRAITSTLYGGDREQADPPGDPARRRRRPRAGRRRDARRPSST